MSDRWRPQPGDRVRVVMGPAPRGRLGVFRPKPEMVGKLGRVERVYMEGIATPTSMCQVLLDQPPAGEPRTLEIYATCVTQAAKRGPDNRFGALET